MGNTGFVPTLPVLEEYNHNELSVIQLAEDRGKRAERQFIATLIKQTYKKPSQQMQDLLARLETYGYDSEQAS